MSSHDPLIVALDFESESEAFALIEALGDEISFYKVGMELYASAGMEFVRKLIASGRNVFLDMKFYDIPETVKRAVAQVSCSGVRFLTVHGSNAVMRAAVDGRGISTLRLLAVTVLTSFDESDLEQMGYPVSVSDLVALRVRNAMACGIDGIAVVLPLAITTARRATSRWLPTSTVRRSVSVPSPRMSLAPVASSAAAGRRSSRSRAIQRTREETLGKSTLQSTREAAS